MTREHLIAKHIGNPSKLLRLDIEAMLDEYAIEIEEEYKAQLTEMTAEKNRWFDRYVQSDTRADILDGELRITQKKMEVLASMLDKGTNPSVL